MVAPHAAASHKVGPFDVSCDGDELLLRLERQGELSIPGCLMFGSTMIAILVIGVLSILHTHATTTNGISLDNPTQVFSPSRNHFGFLWLAASILMIVLLPLYVLRAYNGALEYHFRRSEDAFLKGSKKLSRLSRFEYVSIRETRDPDRRFIYLLNLVYNDGQELQLHNCYEEREAMNLANEISSFVGCPVKWKQGRTA